MTWEDLLAYSLAKPGAWQDEPWEGDVVAGMTGGGDAGTGPVGPAPRTAWLSGGGLPDGQAAGLDAIPLPTVPVSAGALIFDRAGRLLILKPTYKTGWTIPGGVMEADGETPWEACRREVREECGIDVHRARLAVMDFRRPRPGRPGGIRFLFDCGRLVYLEDGRPVPGVGKPAGS